jgi:hypothetical protein
VGQASAESGCNFSRQCQFFTIGHICANGAFSPRQ